MTKPDNIRLYDDNAKQLAARYGRITTEEALPPFVHILNKYTGPSHTALDIGSGSGRDAFWVAGHGWHVDAVDGSKALLAEAAALHNHPNIYYMHDLAPAFNAVRARNTAYDVILMSAFIFHFDQADRQTILEFCRNILAPSGLIYLTLRRGPDLANRNIYDVPLTEIENFAAENGFSQRCHGRGKDSASPDNVSWDHISLWCGAAWKHAEDFTL
jgi:SAM-dependent methyltransferase